MSRGLGDVYKRQGYEFAGNYRAVDSHIKRLRAKLDAYPHNTFTIATVWGAGYKFERNLP